jgi:polysaccharide transporter, PST family
MVSSVEGPAELRASLKQSSAQGAAITLGSQLAKFAIQIAYQTLLARILSPSDFGLVAMTAPILAFVQLFADLGLSQATIQRPRISEGQLSILFWINVAASASLGLLTLAVSPLVGSFYGEPRVVAITAISGSMFILGGLYSQHIALLNRNLAFGKLAVIELTAITLGASAGLASALRGLGYWSILVGQGTISFVTLSFAWALCNFRPGLPKRGEQWQSLVAFGGNLTGFNVVNYFARNLDNVLIGKFNGRDALGLYDRAYRLMLMPLSQVSQPLARVALPLLSRMQAEPELYRKAYTRTLELLLVLTYPGIAFVLVSHDQLILLLLGEKWAGISPIFGILAIGALFAPIGNSTGWLFLSQDRTREMRNWGAVSSALFVLSFAMGLPWGPVGVAACYVTVGGVIQGPLLLWACTRSGPVALRDVLRALLPHALSVLICCAVEFTLARVLPAGLGCFLLQLALCYPLYFAALLIAPGRTGILKTVWEQGRPALVRLGIVR